MSIVNIISRWWHGKGFGIQSRNDYDYLKDVLKETLPYYAYDEIKGKRARLIYRVCLHEGNVGRTVTLTGHFTPEEQRAAILATPCTTSTLTHLHGQQTVIIGGIDHSTDDHASQLWQQALRSNAITWDMGTIGIVRFVKDRYPEHYQI